MLTDTARNKLIVDDIFEGTSAGKKVLVLSERKEHLEDGHYQVILSTGQFFGEGVDIRGISCLILAFPFSFEGKLIQYIGRLRDIGEQRLLIDYRDKKIPFLERQFKHRERYYKKVDAKISSKDPAEMSL